MSIIVQNVLFEEFVEKTIAEKKSQVCFYRGTEDVAKKKQQVSNLYMNRSNEQLESSRCYKVS